MITARKKRDETYIQRLYHNLWQTRRRKKLKYQGFFQQEFEMKKGATHAAKHRKVTTSKN